MTGQLTASGQSRPAERAQPLGGGVIAVTAASALFVVAGYVINLALGRALGPVDYGLFGVVIGLMTVVNALQVSAVPQAVARFVAERAYRPADLLLTGALLQLGTGLVLSLALFVLADQIATVLGDRRLAVGLRFAALALPPYALFTLLLGFQGGRGRYVRQALMLSTYSTGKASLAVGLGLLFALPGAVAGYVIAPVIGILTGGAVDLRRSRLVSLRPVLAYSLPLLLLAALSMGYLNADLFVVKSLVADPAAAGFYTAAQSVARVPYFLTTGLAIILLPAVARALDGTARAALVGEAMRFALLLVTPVAVVLMASADDLVRLLYTDQYAPAAAALTLLAPAMGAFALVTLFASLLAGGGRPSHAVAAAGSGLACSSVLAVVLVPRLGAEGAAIATLSGSVVALSIATVAALRAFTFRVPWLTLARASVASALVGSAALVLDGTAATLIGLPVLALVYGLLLLLMREVGPGDWQRVRALVPDGLYGERTRRQEDVDQTLDGRDTNSSSKQSTTVSQE